MQQILPINWKQDVPGLRSGYIVLSDRYIYTLMAREAVGINGSWSRNLYGFALRPDIVFYLDVDPNGLVHRVFKRILTWIIMNQVTILDYQITC